jgi:hypothetical protein
LRHALLEGSHAWIDWLLWHAWHHWSVAGEAWSHWTWADDWSGHGLADDLAVVADDGVRLVDHCQDLSQSWSLDGIEVEHAGDEVDELRTVAELSHECQLLADAIIGQSESLHVVEVSQWVVASGAERCNTESKDLILLIVDVSDTSIMELTSKVRVSNLVVIDLLVIEDTLDSASELRIDWLVNRETRVEGAVEIVGAESVEFLWRQGGVVVLLLQHAVVAVEILAKQWCFEKLDSLIGHNENMSRLNISM